MLKYYSGAKPPDQRTSDLVNLSVKPLIWTVMELNFHNLIRGTWYDLSARNGCR